MKPAALSAFAVALALTAWAQAADVRIEHVTVISAERAAPLEDAIVVVHEGRIASVTAAKAAPPAGAATVIDARGLFLTPGLIDAHVHLGDVPGMRPDQEAAHPGIANAAFDQMPRSFLLYGFTTLIDLVSTPRAMAAWRKHELVPDTFFCGATPVMDGYPTNYSPKPQRYLGFPYMLVEPPAPAPAGVDPAAHTPRAVVARIKADGALCVKAFFERGFDTDRNLPVPSRETIRALVAAAHAAGLPVLLHANGAEGHAFALDAGVDVVVHGLWNWGPVTATGDGLPPPIQAILDREIAAKIGWEPTRQVLQGIRDLASTTFLADPRLAAVVPASLIAWYRTSEGQWFKAMLMPDGDVAGIDPVIAHSRQATAYMVKNGARILFGSDTPSAPTFANPPGLNGFLEMQRLVESGETPAQIFASATVANARTFKLDRDVGTVEAGKRANLLLLRQDPTKTIDAYANIAKVILGGRVIEAAELRADRREAASR